MATVSKRPATMFLNGGDDRLLEAVRKGLTPQAACRLLGISYNTYRYWMAQGGAQAYCNSRQYVPAEDAAPHFREFVERVAQAERDRKGPPVRSFKVTGRLPYDLEPHEQDAVLALVATGISTRQACIQSGVLHTTVKAWLRRGGYQGQISKVLVTEPYKTFTDKFERAESTHVAKS